MIIIPIKWLFHWEYTQHFQTNPYVFLLNIGAMNPSLDDQRPFRRVVHQESAPDDPLDMSELDPEHGSEIEDTRPGELT